MSLMKNITKRLLPEAIRTYFETVARQVACTAAGLHDLEHRVWRLEQAVDTLIESPEYVPSSDRGFNGQCRRKQIFMDLLAAIRFRAIVETGTFVGDTTGFMAQASQLPVHTSESNRRFHMLAKRRLRNIATIHFTLGDSRAFLVDLAQAGLAEPLFFYLDAHWYADLPLNDECDLILSHWKDIVIMIDDFQTPDDDGYGYDDYGDGKRLSAAYLRSTIFTHRLAVFYPSAPAVDETGAKRGCVVLTRQGPMSRAIQSVPSLQVSQ